MQEVNIHTPVLTKRLQQLLHKPAPGVPFVRIEQPVPVCNLLTWLEHQNAHLQRSYWRDRDADIEIATLGQCWKMPIPSRQELSKATNTVQRLINDSGHWAEKARSLLWLSFSDVDRMVWPTFGYGCVYLPGIEMQLTRKGATLACYIQAGTDELWQSGIRSTLKQLDAINWQVTGAREAYQLGPVQYQPDQAGWNGNIAKATRAFAAGEMQKVVLSRSASLTIEGVFSPWRLLQRWRTANPRSYVFAVEAKCGDLFFGCTPERLMARRGRVLHTEALAGTTPRGGTREEDKVLEQTLLSDRKNIHENRLVLNDIRERLGVLCQSLEADRSHSVVKLKSIQHLRYLIRGVLHAGVTDAQLLTALHPTPAVGGTSREVAMSFIEQREGYARGLYAGVFGIVSPEHTEMAVTIRSGLLRRLSDNLQQLSLFSGGGIVQGSVAAEEWQELNNKLATVYSLLKDAEQETVAL
ncbi:isochorismate synthase MenF [Endozoicomonas montiporae]|uniref:isochorismate synthase n=1 Tax=Endozoicomonas montiporae CL-33 TaxID=570277 RepID=A0A142BEV6_9GAMM|nr:isochorismate synthase [Endozoicomonas montiporae]AMO57282.1 isochorismate synthase [Endozoicomonas montiporae CL-33]